MITYVNTVLVSNKNNSALATADDIKGSNNKADLQSLVGKFVFMNCDPAKQDGSAIEDPYTPDANCDKFKIGVIKDAYITKFDNATGKQIFIPQIKRSNIIQVADIKSLAILNYKDDSEDKVIVDFTNIGDEEKQLFANGGIPVVLRLTFKDTPTRYRKWSESYDYVTKVGDTPADIIKGLARTITMQARRARVYAEADGTKLILTAMEYDDDNSNSTENFAAKVRFNANVWYSDPKAPGFASTNKYGIGTISKEVGVNYPASAKNVRDHERTAQGYEGIFHRSKWYDPKPAIVADINAKYSGFTLEFENMYRTADDLFRKTKQTVEVYASNNGEEMAASEIAGGLVNVISTMLNNRQIPVNKIDNSDAYDPENFKA
jgi:hypothetical protein